MITINLLPEEFRPKEKISFNLPYLKIVYGVGGLIVAISLFLYVDFWIAKSKLKTVDSEWKMVEPQSMRLKQLEQEVETVLRPENVFLKRFVTSDYPLTGILGWINEALPLNMWLTELKLKRIGEGSELSLKGLALPSKERSSIESIEKFLHDIKSKIPEVELSLTTSRQKIKEIELTQFIAQFKWGMVIREKKA